MTICSNEQPFPGLRPFEFSDSQYFFGRSASVLSLYNALLLSRFVAVVGASGSGKTSLVRAGLLPTLLDEDRSQWRFVILRPGDNPLEFLSRALVASALDPADGPVDFDGERKHVSSLLRSSSFGLLRAIDALPGMAGRGVLLVVDQFEEVFHAMYSHAPQGRDDVAMFVQLLLTASHDRGRAVKSVVTMDSAFIGDCAAFAGLPEAVSDGLFLMPAMSRSETEECIQRPITAAGATIGGALVERILNDFSDERSLPVLQHCLWRLWNASCEGGVPPRIGQASYEAIGKLDNALNFHADSLLHSLLRLEPVVEQVFRALTEWSGDGFVTRRPVSLARLVAECGAPEAEVREVVDRFRSNDAQLLVPSSVNVPLLAGDVVVDVAHESLLRQWDRLSGSANLDSEGFGWLADEQRDGRVYRALLGVAEEQEHRQSSLASWPGMQAHIEWWFLRPRTSAWADRYGGRFDVVDRLIRDAAHALDAERQKTEKEHRRETVRRERFLWVGGIVLAAVGILTGTFGIWALIVSRH
jgi:hypothetical protein